MTSFFLHKTWFNPLLGNLDASKSLIRLGENMSERGVNEVYMQEISTLRVRVSGRKWYKAN